MFLDKKIKLSKLQGPCLMKEVRKVPDLGLGSVFQGILIGS